MKKLSFLFAFVVLAFALAVTGCKKDDKSSDNDSGNNGGGGVAGKHLTRITDICTYYWQDGSIYDTDIVEYRFKYTDNLVTQWMAYDDGELDYIAYLSYDNGLLSRADITYTTKDDMTIYFNYYGQYLTSADIFYGSEHEVVTYAYQNGKLSQMVAPEITFNLNWIEDDVSRLNVVYEGSDIYTYDSKVNPIDKQVAILIASFEEDFEYLSQHNVKRKQWISSTGGSGHTTEYNYTYDASNKYPVSRTYSATYTSGYYDEGTTEYEYGN